MYPNPILSRIPVQAAFANQISHGSTFHNNQLVAYSMNNAAYAASMIYTTETAGYYLTCILRPNSVCASSLPAMELTVCRVGIVILQEKKVAPLALDTLIRPWPVRNCRRCCTN